MDNDITEFTYDLSKISIRQSDDFVAVVPIGLDTEEKLFDALEKELKFPSYFGRNWDALLDCLRDFSWIERRRIIIIHREVPPLSERSLSLYIDTLKDAIRDWKHDAQHELIVFFPNSPR